MTQQRISSFFSVGITDDEGQAQLHRTIQERAAESQQLAIESKEKAARKKLREPFLSQMHENLSWSQAWLMMK